MHSRADTKSSASNSAAFAGDGRGSDEMDDDRIAGDVQARRIRAIDVANDDFRARWNLALRPRTNEGSHDVTTRDETRNQASSDVAGSACQAWTVVIAPIADWC